MLNRSLIIIILFLSLSACGLSSTEDEEKKHEQPSAACAEVGEKILNGDICYVGDSPVVMLEFRNSSGNPEAICSGTAVTQNAIVTAAHCFDTTWGEIIVHAGGDKYRASGYQKHPNYRGTNVVLVPENDVAVVFVEDELNVRTYPLLTNSAVRKGESGIIAGYGIDEYSDLDGLQAGTLVIDEVDGQYIVDQYDGHGNSNSCMGDSGGPLLINRGRTYILAGITSAGTSEDCSEGDIAIYTNVSNGAINQFILGLVPDAARI